MKQVLSVLTVLLLMALSLCAGEKQTATVNVTVVRETNGKPVRNASVIFHSVNKEGKQRNDEFQLKTDEDGKAALEGLQFGKYRVQVIAEHLQTYGDDLDISAAEKDLMIKMKAPQKQYSIY